MRTTLATNMANIAIFTHCIDCSAEQFYGDPDGGDWFGHGALHTYAWNEDGDLLWTEFEAVNTDLELVTTETHQGPWGHKHASPQLICYECKLQGEIDTVLKRGY